MGKTVPSYRIAIEWEIAKWKQFRNSLSSDAHKQAFDEMMDMCRAHAMAGGNACNQIIFEPAVVSMLLGQQIRIRHLEGQLKELSKILSANRNEEKTPNGDIANSAEIGSSEKVLYPKAFSRGIRLSVINSKFKDSVTPFIGTFQRLGFIKILY
jgi:hypothetical protein